MATAKITLWGMYNYLQQNEDDLFTNLNLPADMDANTFIGTVMQKGAEFEVLYADPEWFKSFIGVWSDKYYAMFERQLRALLTEYNPLENYDRREEWSDARSNSRETTDEDSRSRSTAESGTNERSGNSSETTGDSKTVDSSTTGSTMEHGTSVGNNDTELKVSAYDSSAYQPKEQTQVDTDTNTESSSMNVQEVNSSESGLRSSQSSDQETDRHMNSILDTDQGNRRGSEHGNESGMRVGRAHGNIGVTTSQQMLQAEWDVAKLNIYEEAADLFLTEFCIYTY